jgi:hypothetical protein
MEHAAFQSNYVRQTPTLWALRPLADDDSLLDDTGGWNIIYPVPITIIQEAGDSGHLVMSTKVQPYIRGLGFN